MNELTYLIEYIPTPMGVEISNFMSKLDLGIDHISTTGEFVITTTTEPTLEYRNELEKLMVKSIEDQGGKVYSINLVSVKKIIK